MILHVIENLRETHGGPTFAAIGLAVQQAARGKAVAIACREGPSTPEMRRFLEGDAGRRPVHLEVIAEPNTAAMTAIVARLEPQIIHVHGVWDRMIRTTVASAHNRRIPWVVTSHGMLHPVALSKRRFAKWAYLRIWCRVVRGAGHVMVLNGEELSHVARHLHRPCSIVPAGVDVVADLPVPTGEFRRSLPALGNRPFVMFLGRLDRIKGIDRLLDAYALAVRGGIGMDLVVAGPEFGEGESVRSRIRDLGIERTVHLPGPLWGRRKLDALAECAIYAHRPRYEGYGLAVVEAMAAGRPVVTTAACHVDEARDAGAILLAADDDRAFADALLHLASHPVEAGELGRRAHAWVLARGGWPAIEGRVDAVYRAVASRTSSVASAG